MPPAPSADTPGLDRAFERELDRLALSPGRWLVAVSGGPDSLALLHLLLGGASARGFDLVVAHVDHGMHPASDAIAARVADAARRCGLPVTSARLALGPDASESTARRARLGWLRDECRRRDANGVFLAHHADDQAETVLMRVLRGSGPAGLAAMRARAGLLVRPLLPFRRSALARYLLERGVEGWLDPANRDVRHLRSWLRAAVLPAVRARLPDVDDRLLEVARQARAQVDAWDAVLDALPGVAVATDGGGVSLDAGGISALDPALGVEVVRAAARRGGAALTAAAARRALALAARGRSGQRAALGAGWRAELAFGRLVLSRPERVHDQPLHGYDGELRWGAWRMRWRHELAGHVLRGGWQTWVTPGTLEVGPPRPGERLHPVGGTGRRHLVRLFQDGKVGRGAREAWPVLRRAGAPLWVPGVARGSAEVPAPGTDAVRIDVEPA